MLDQGVKAHTRATHWLQHGKQTDNKPAVSEEIRGGILFYHEAERLWKMKEKVMFTKITKTLRVNITFFSKSCF